MGVASNVGVPLGSVSMHWCLWWLTMFASVFHGLALMTILWWAFLRRSPESWNVCFCVSGKYGKSIHTNPGRSLLTSSLHQWRSIHFKKRSPFPSLPSSPCEFVVKISGSAKSFSVQTLSSYYKELELGIDRHRGSSLAFDSSKALFLKVALLLWTRRKCRAEEKREHQWR